MARRSGLALVNSSIHPLWCTIILTLSGGWEFSDAGPTHQTWSLMASSKANRQAFISSLLEFLKKWDFAGVDIDWEWPGSDTRGGNAAVDKQNQVDLMKELRAALGSRGLSVVLPAQYAYLQNMDPKALEGSVDAFNVLAYDLHGVSGPPPSL
jgi:GH18 family chitinase